MKFVICVAVLQSMYCIHQTFISFVVERTLVDKDTLDLDTDEEDVSSIPLKTSRSFGKKYDQVCVSDNKPTTRARRSIASTRNISNTVSVESKKPSRRSIAVIPCANINNEKTNTTRSRDKTITVSDGAGGRKRPTKRSAAEDRSITKTSYRAKNLIESVEYGQLKSCCVRFMCRNLYIGISLESCGMS